MASEFSGYIQILSLVPCDLQQSTLTALSLHSSSAKWGNQYETRRDIVRNVRDTVWYLASGRCSPNVNTKESHQSTALLDVFCDSSSLCYSSPMRECCHHQSAGGEETGTCRDKMMLPGSRGSEQFCTPSWRIGCGACMSHHSHVMSFWQPGLLSPPLTRWPPGEGSRQGFILSLMYPLGSHFGDLRKDTDPAAFW